MTIYILLADHRHVPGTVVKAFKTKKARNAARLQLIREMGRGEVAFDMFESELE